MWALMDGGDRHVPVCIAISTGRDTAIPSTKWNEKINYVRIWKVNSFLPSGSCVSPLIQTDASASPLNFG